MSRQKPYRTIRAVIECRVPEHVTEKDLVWAFKHMIKWPIQLGHKGDPSTLVRPEFKQFGRVVTALRKREEGFWSRVRMGTHRHAD